MRQRRDPAAAAADVLWAAVAYLRDGPWPAYLRIGVLTFGLAFVAARGSGMVWREAYDAFSYWAVDLDHLYGDDAGMRPGGYGFFPYSPAVAILMLPLGLLSWYPFLGIWTAIIGSSLVALTGWLALPLAWYWWPLQIELIVGNVDLLIALAIVLGFRYPAAWAFVLLTKSTCGIGLIWFAVRREWRSLGIALGVTAAIAAISFLLVPQAWFDWVSVLLASSGEPPPAAWLKVSLWIRLPIAAAIVTVAARFDQRWLVPVACTVALPVVWESALSILVAVVPLLGASVRSRLGVPRWVSDARAPSAA